MLVSLGWTIMVSVLQRLKMGSSVRRLWLYYSNNFRKTHMIALLGVIGFLIWLFRPQTSDDGTIVKSPYGVVRYKKVAGPERMNAEDVERALAALVDTRPLYCRDNKYDFTRLEPPETVSIIVDFHGASFYNLKLTLSSIIEHTPYDLYTEIIVLDDGTTDDNVRQNAAKFLQDAKFNKVKMYRSESRGGQSASWFKSSVAAVGNFLVFVDSSVVVNTGWLQPLLSKLVEDENVIVAPHADNILDDDRFFRTDESLVNVLTWSLSTVYYEATAAANDWTGETLNTPVARGDVIAVRRSFLESIGGFDDGLRDDPGFGQHVELSLRAWMCGGSVRIVSCSHVAVRNSLRPRRVSDGANARRITELWFDGDFRKIVYRQVNQQTPADEAESLADRRAMLKKTTSAADCRPFSWYLANVATMIVTPSDSMTKFGKLRAKTNYCIRTTGTSGVVEMDLCREYMYEPEAMFEMNAEGVIFRGDDCLVPDKSGRLTIAACDEDSVDQKWHFTSDSRLVFEAKRGLCLAQISERDPDTMELHHYARLLKCSDPDQDLRKELWKFLTY